jgi:hypothetical protein
MRDTILDGHVKAFKMHTLYPRLAFSRALCLFSFLQGRIRLQQSAFLLSSPGSYHMAVIDLYRQALERKLLALPGHLAV